MRILYGGVDFKQEERDAINRVLDRNWWGLAEEGEAFERELAQVQGVKHAIFVTSGSSALELGIAASGLNEGDEVIVPATTFPTPVASLIRQGLVPVIADTDEYNFLDVESFKKNINSDTKAVLLVYVAGNVGNLDEILTIAKEHDLLVFEDNCDGFGGTYKGKMLGSFGHFSTISTHAAHIISTGQGGVVFTDDDELAERVRSLRDWGRDLNYRGNDMPKEYSRYIYTHLGYNQQPLELQAAMGRVQLKRLQEFKQKRLRNFEYLYDHIEGAIMKPFLNPDAEPCWYTFPILVKDRFETVMDLNEKEIDWRPILAGNIAKQPVYKDKVIVRESLEHADLVFEHGLWLPIHPTLSLKDMSYVAESL